MRISFSLDKPDCDQIAVRRDRGHSFCKNVGLFTLTDNSPLIFSYGMLKMKEKCPYVVFLGFDHLMQPRARFEVTLFKSVV